MTSQLCLLIHGVKDLFIFNEDSVPEVAQYLRKLAQRNSSESVISEIAFKFEELSTEFDELEGEMTCPDCGGHGDIRYTLDNAQVALSELVDESDYVCERCEGTGKFEQYDVYRKTELLSSQIGELNELIAENIDLLTALDEEMEASNEIHCN